MEFKSNVAFQLKTIAEEDDSAVQKVKKLIPFRSHDLTCGDELFAVECGALLEYETSISCEVLLSGE